MAEKSVEYSELLTLTSDIVANHTSHNAYASGLPDLADFLTPESLTPR